MPKKMTMTVATMHHVEPCSKIGHASNPRVVCDGRGCWREEWTSMPKPESAEWHLRIAKNTNACGQSGRGTYKDDKVSCPDCEVFMFADESEDARVAAGYV